MFVFVISLLQFISKESITIMVQMLQGLGSRQIVIMKS